MQNVASPKTPTILPGRPAVTGGFAATLRHAPSALFAKLATWQHQAEERALLARLSDHQLHDMGLTRGDVEDMARKPFWSR